MAEISAEDRDALIAAQSMSATTKRATVPALEEILYEPLPVLDHGFIRVVDYMGDDAAIVQAARVSYGKGTRQASQDEGLIRYLMRHRHTSPFEMCEIKLHVKLPMFIARQWIRHRTANVNEYSARYSILDKEFYVPAADQLAVQSSINNQGRGEAINHDDAEKILDLMKGDAAQAFNSYERLINSDADGKPLDPERPALARELARIGLPLSTYTQWYWKTDLHNLFHFMALRADSHAQYEIRVYADVIRDIANRWVPLASKAFEDYRLHGVELSRDAIEVVRRRLRGENVERETTGLSLREWRELQDLLGE
ncbi:MAG: FAD-dependent thymidylate synthase [Alphaproteobacteria bacterium]|jgi:thymidylate synthase (FAD)